jgi:hypothetical protein
VVQLAPPAAVLVLVAVAVRPPHRLAEARVVPPAVVRAAVVPG